MSVWKEVWSWKPLGGGHSGEVTFPKGRMGVFFDPANYTKDEGAERGRLAAAAPEMARLLVQVNALADCYFCHADVQATGFHEPDCRLVSVARKAGLPLRGMPDDAAPESKSEGEK